MKINKYFTFACFSTVSKLVLCFYSISSCSNLILANARIVKIISTTSSTNLFTINPQRHSCVIPCC
jgi:hypothetical protein